MISVVVPAYNEEKYIGECIKALASQTTKEKYEVILVDNASTDNTAKEASRYKTRMDLKIVRENRKGRGSARFTGFKQAKGDIILSTDADTIVPPVWIEKMVDALRKSDAAGVTGTIIITDAGWHRNLFISTFYVSFITGYKIFTGHFWLSGFSFAIYKDIYEKVGGFNTKMNAQEDTELSKRVAKIGKIKLVTDVPVNFSGRRFKKGFVRGFLPYISTFVSGILLKRESILSDVR